MRYLECIALLNYQLRKLCAGQRTQVPVSVADETLQTLMNIQTLLGDNVGELTMRINDIMRAIGIINSTQGMVVLTETMKKTLVDGLTEIHDAICLRAFEYYKVTDFEPTEQIIPVMRRVVEVALEKGVI